MNDARGDGPEPTWRGRSEEETVAELVAEAGPRPPLPDAELAAIRAAARATWVARYGRRRAPLARPVVRLAAAALLATGIGLIWWAVGGPGEEPQVVATVVRVQGAVTLTADAGGSTGGLAPDAVVTAGTAVATPAGGGLTLRLRDGTSLRIDQATRVRLVAERLVALERGGLYVDDGGQRAGAPSLAVSTAVGTFTDVGTQFELRAEPATGGTGGGVAVRLRVREGRVELRRDGAPLVASAGEELRVGAAGPIARGEVSAHGEAWAWAVAGAPMMEVDGVRLGVFLRWAAREGGWRLELADEVARSRSAEVVLHGSIAELSVAEALDAMLASCGLTSRIEGGVLLVRAAAAG